VKLRLGSERRLIVAVQVRSITDAKNVTITLVEADAVLLLRAAAFPALQPPVNDVGHRSISGCPTGGTVAAGRSPFPGHDVVAGRFWRLGGHPEPDCGLERDGGIASNNVGVVYAIESDCVPGRSIVVVP